MMRTSKYLIIVLILFPSFSNIKLQNQGGLASYSTIRIGCKVNPSDYKDELYNKNINYSLGLDLEIIALLRKEFEDAGKTTEFKVVESKYREKVLEDDEVDLVIATYSITEDRTNRIDFSIPYANNPGLVFITHVDGNYHYLQDLLYSDAKISVVESSTADSQLVDFSKAKNENIDITRIDNYENAKNRLKRKETDAHLDDFYNVMYDDLSDPDIQMIGLFPSKEFKPDMYAIGVQKGKTEFLTDINEILKNKKELIKSLNQKWFEIPNNNVLFSLRNLPLKPSFIEKIYSKYGIWIVLVAFLGLAVFVFSFIMVNRKTTKELKNNFADTQDKLSTQIKDIKNELKSSTLDEDEIIKTGIHFFNNCEKEIYYIGAGGFISSHREEWREAIKNCIEAKKRRMIRIVDLPLYSEAVKIFTEKDLIDYLIWLIVQAVELKNSGEYLELYNSRGAPLWGHGFIIMIKDKKEMMLFTGGSGKSGSRIQKEQVVRNYLDTADQLLHDGERIWSDGIWNDYFRGSQYIDEAKKLVERYQDNLPIFDIKKLCKKFLNEVRNAKN
jgi:ABC-type amino acid transport substrate-binding protein